MKKFSSFFTIIFILTILIVSLEAQEKPIKYGIRFGPQLTYMNIDLPMIDPAIRFAMCFGGLVEYEVTPVFSVQMNILYNAKGMKWSKTYGTVTPEATWSLNYLSFPILAKFAFGQKTKLYLTIGPEIGFLLSAKHEDKVIEFVLPDDDIKEYLTSTEIAISSGWGIQIPMQNMSLFIETRGTISLNDTIKDRDVLVVEEGTARNIIGSLHLGFLF